MTELNAEPPPPSASDKAPGVCHSPDNPAPSLPSWARLPINRCNLPAVILGSVTFQRHPTALRLDGVEELHAGLFALLDREDDAHERARLFREGLAAHFCLDSLEDAGLDAHTHKRAKANWLRMLRGWSFDSDSREGAALKGWVESRFGLVPRFHIDPLRDFTGPAWHRYESMRAAGVSGTNAIEGQLDLLYAWCQREFARLGAQPRLTLYRGINRIDEHEVLSGNGRRQVVLFNNLASFTSSRERAGEFGDWIIEADVPTAKVFFHCGLTPGVLKGEGEHLVIGGAYEVAVGTL
ncbi:MAG: NAD(+)--dinitrogen-reductase ADP-D-ribosyltransferase [Candidatus Nitricoxidivorans perseverans]|uniref:NAD(+)--dinitrogen-reductase ADP-D-ribosyltransferase n=1 Tax=Candidatus Nitricoxidivorans perseverans TaxID=2975601 RepID=A0AA49J021_9PROT|nr:MAG: NAD(+)--dinitrogen-reductase ADP-D-ribosyltransferase [Candidatus Nitricoxidivorans perseverans]